MEDVADPKIQADYREEAVQRSFRLEIQQQDFRNLYQSLEGLRVGCKV